MDRERQLSDLIRAKLAAKEAARDVARRYLEKLGPDPVPGRHDIGTSIGFQQCTSHANDPNFLYMCESDPFSCGSTFSCSVMFYDCWFFTCPAGGGGYSCQGQPGQGRDYVCAQNHTCAGAFNCSRDHGYYCAATDTCDQNFSCNNNGGVTACNGTPMNEYTANNGTPGDYICGLNTPGVIVGNFECSAQFSCSAADQFICDSPQGGGRFHCISGAAGSFACNAKGKGKAGGFSCSPNTVSGADPHNYSCSGKTNQYHHMES